MLSISFTAKDSDMKWIAPLLLLPVIALADKEAEHKAEQLGWADAILVYCEDNYPAFDRKFDYTWDSSPAILHQLQLDVARPDERKTLYDIFKFSRKLFVNYPDPESWNYLYCLRIAHTIKIQLRNHSAAIEQYKEAHPIKVFSNNLLYPSVAEITR